jgi:hypothetical protein
MTSSSKILIPCEHRLSVDGHLWCSHPRVSIQWSANFLTTDPFGRRISVPVRCRTCKEQDKPDLVNARIPPEKFVYPVQRRHHRHWKLPRWLSRARNFLKAAGLHIARGSPRCTPNEIATRQSICAQNICGLYRNGVCAHSSCGCGVNVRAVVAKKLQWADQQCPVGLWPKIQWRLPWRR